MISNHAMAASHPLASLMTRQGKLLDVEPRSALSRVTACSDVLSDRAFVDSQDQMIACEQLAPADAVFQAASAESLDGVNDHDLQMDEVVERATHATRFAFDFTRNVVNPQIARVVEATQAYVDGAVKKRMEPMVIEPVFTSRLYDTTAMQELVAPFREATLTNVAPVRLTAQWPENGLSDALKTGDAALDSQVSDHFSGREADVQTLWQRYYSNTPGTYRPTDMTAEPANADDSLVLFLGAHQLLESDQVPEGLDIDLPTYRAYLAKMREQSGARLNYLYSKDQNRVKSRQLVIRAPTKPARGGIPSGTIQVSGEVYNDWLSKGGSPEALYQAVHEGATMQYDVLLADAEGLAKRWLTTMGLLETQRKFERQTAITTGLRAALHQLYRDLPPSLKEFVPYGSDGEFLSAVAERLSHFHIKDLDNMYLVARKAICRVFYPQTHAEKILNALDNVMQDHPQYDAREAAFFVMVDYVTEWVTDAFIVKSLPGAPVSANT